MPITESRYQKYGHQEAILKVTLLKINRLLPIHTGDVPVKFGLNIQSHTKVRVWKPKIPIWLPGSHFESDVPENQQASAHSHKQHAYVIWIKNSKSNLSHALETMSSSDVWTDRQTDRQGESRWVGGGIMMVICIVSSVRHIDGLVQERRKFIAKALELWLSCTYPLICSSIVSGRAISIHRKLILKYGRKPYLAVDNLLPW